MWALSSEEGPGVERVIGGKSIRGWLRRKSAWAMAETDLTPGSGGFHHRRWNETRKAEKEQVESHMARHEKVSRVRSVGRRLPEKDRQRECGKMQKCQVRRCLRMCHWIFTSHCLSSKFCQKGLRFFCKIALLFCNTMPSLWDSGSPSPGTSAISRKLFSSSGKKRKRNKERKLKSLFLFDLTWVDRHMFKI